MCPKNTANHSSGAHKWPYRRRRAYDVLVSGMLKRDGRDGVARARSRAHISPADISNICACAFVCVCVFLCVHACKRLRRTSIYLPSFFFFFSVGFIPPLSRRLRSVDTDFIQLVELREYTTFALIGGGGGPGGGRERARAAYKKNPVHVRAEDICLTKHTIKGSTRPEYIIIVVGRPTGNGVRARARNRSRMDGTRTRGANRSRIGCNYKGCNTLCVFSPLKMYSIFYTTLVLTQVRLTSC